MKSQDYKSLHCRRSYQLHEVGLAGRPIGKPPRRHRKHPQWNGVRSFRTASCCLGRAALYHAIAHFRRRVLAALRRRLKDAVRLLLPPARAAGTPRRQQRQPRLLRPLREAAGREVLADEAFLRRLWAAYTSLRTAAAGLYDEESRGGQGGGGGVADHAGYGVRALTRCCSPHQPLCITHGHDHISNTHIVRALFLAHAHTSGQLMFRHTHKQAHTLGCLGLPVSGPADAPCHLLLPTGHRRRLGRAPHTRWP